MKLFATFFFVGKIPFAPGTFGTIAGAVVYFWLIATGIITNKTLAPIALCFTILISIISTHIYIKTSSNKDPKEVVIDEVAGIFMTLWLSQYMMQPLGVYLYYTDLKDLILYFTFSIVFFRIFDILKPFPIRWIDKTFKNAFGVVFDDLLAALISSVCVALSMRFALTFIPHN